MFKSRRTQAGVRRLGQRRVNPLVDQVRKILGSNNQGLILMVRG